ncbi:hypothetical protein O3M35_010073 [Rhynocoris fuscipes]|uniref:Uncharacterized protein n=1 Tax=Rhynocoris fuscipes TaxID=488301 RepID=A0AAW1D0S1_9HEMI
MRREISHCWHSLDLLMLLEMKVLNDEITVQEISEKQKHVKDQVENITEIMRTLSMYAHCLEMRHNIAIRLQRLINQIVPRKEYNSNESFKWESVSKSLNDIYHICSENSDLPTVYFDNLEDHFEKQNDFSKASTNFCRVLQQQTDLSNNQLRKLELQYDEIKLQYKNSSTSIDSHLNEIIDTRASVAEKCLQNMAPILQCTIEEERSMWRFLKEITFSNINHQYQPDRVLSVKSLPEKLGAKSNEEKPILCTCPPSNFFQKSGIGYKMN